MRRATSCLRCEPIHWFACIALVIAGAVFFEAGASAESSAESQSLPRPKPELTNGSEHVAEAVQVGSVAVEATAAEDDHQTSHDHKPQAKHVGELHDQVVAGINTTSNDLKDLLAPGTIVHFWASWCRPCEAEFPELIRFYQQHISGDLGVKGIRLVTISNDFKVAAAVRFIEKHGVEFPVYIDTEQATNLAIVGKRTLPATVIVDAKGRFHRLALGKLDWAFLKLPDILVATASRGSGAEKSIVDAVDATESAVDSVEDE